jgi:hypothetical protein
MPSHSGIQFAVFPTAHSAHARQVEVVPVSFGIDQTFFFDHSENEFLKVLVACRYLPTASSTALIMQRAAR